MQYLMVWCCMVEVVRAALQWRAAGCHNAVAMVCVVQHSACRSCSFLGSWVVCVQASC
jgi:hypothetical protein